MEEKFQARLFVIYRFANRIPLLYDEASDVSYRVITGMNWRRYKASPDMPIAVVVHICSTKVPYKTVGRNSSPTDQRSDVKLQTRFEKLDANCNIS
jgi:DNA topoisomerase-6 subunit B